MPLTACPVCRSGSIQEIVSLGEVPVLCNALLPSRAEAEAAKLGRFDLAQCLSCSHYFNAAFDPELIAYSPSYDTSLHYSPTFTAYAEALADRLVKRYYLAGRAVIELGCGKGEFLKLLVDRKVGSCIGFDTSFSETAGPAPSNVTIVPDYFSAKYDHISADFLVCRHVLEHLADPRKFMRGLAESATARAAKGTYFEVPNALYTFENMGIWDLIYEHVSYFTRESLFRLFSDSGFATLEIDAAYGDQFLFVEAAFKDGAVNGSPCQGRVAGRETSLTFASRMREKGEAWAGRLAEWSRSGERIVVWGAGSKGVSFVNFLRADSNVVGLIDVNPNKVGRFVPGTGHQVFSPTALGALSPDRIVLMNSMYAAEVREMSRDLGCDCPIELA